ncbi:MAG: YHS domain-containing (seleno)protein [Pseudorhodoplanes sp.]|uniref:YHS domain-containing (seleno)protein n=1 Tax=Pseudorhodoplanes sp. TaxID=1934341 RepID=UPI003D11DE41
MTTLRRQRPRFGAGALLLILSGIPQSALSPVVHAATTEQIVVDHHTGLAIYGYDPVAYFTDRAPRLGREDIELKHGGVAWRFHNEGNRAAFAADPDIYMPQYGGHDPVAIANNVARAGHPAFWAIYNDRLYLFYSQDARKAFNDDPGSAALQADAQWPHVGHMLAP